MRQWRYLSVILGVALALIGTSSALGSTASSPVRVTWLHKCIKSYSFCASFPIVYGAKETYEHDVFDSATSVTGKAPDFSSNIWYNSRGRPCRKITLSCQGFEFYAVEVIHSKYADPWTALTAVNGGVKHPVRTRVQGNLAVRFNKGIYDTPGLVIYHRGQVYLLQVGGQYGNGWVIPRYTKRFLASIRLL